MAANLPNFFYSEIASHPDYGHQPMMRCAVDLYKQGGMGKNLITEAVLEDPEARNRFAQGLRRVLTEETRYIFRVPKLIFIEEVMTKLAARRHFRSLADYEAMRAGFQVGSGRFPHGVLPGSEQQSLEERAQWVVNNANALTVDLPAESA